MIKRPNVTLKKDVTPRRKNAVISLSTGRYKSAANSIVAFSKTHVYVLSAVTKQINSEMKNISSLKYNSILRSDHDNVKHFSWVAIWNEFTQKLPTLVSFLRKLLPKSDHKYLLCLICILLKHRCKHMSLFQRVISVLLYANGTSKQVSILASINYWHWCITWCRCTIICICLVCACHQPRLWGWSLQIMMPRCWSGLMK